MEVGCQPGAISARIALIESCLTNKGLRACVRAPDVGYNFVFLTWIFINSSFALAGLLL